MSAQPQPSEAPSEALTAPLTVAQSRGGTPTHPHTREPLRASEWLP